MKALFVFDDRVRINKIKLKNLQDIEAVYLYPLTSKVSFINEIKGVLYDKKIRVEVLNTSIIINQSADEIRNPYIKFIAELPERLRIKGRNLKEFFATPDKVTSLWWFSLVAEKNTIKSDSFNKLAQLHSIIKFAKKIDVGSIVYGATCNRLKNSLISYLHSNAIKFQQIPTENPRTLKEILRDFRGVFSLSHFLFALYHLYIFLSKTTVIKKKLRNIRKEKTLKSPIIIITHYPNIDIEAARKGIFKNKYYPLLQEELERKGRDIVWIAVYVQNNSIPFDRAISYAKNFVINGYNFYLLDEFLDFKSLLSVAQTFLLSCFKFLKIRKKIPELHFLEGEDYNFFPLLKEEWYSSYVGSVAISGIIQYERFKNMFGKHHFGDKCLYYFENHAWEKAMVCARDYARINLKLFGYQHATVTKMLLNYFNHESETSEEKVSFPMPKPDKIICNGDISFNYMRESGWSRNRLTIAEAIRYNSLRGDISNFWKKDNIVLVVLSLSIAESCSILTTVLQGLEDGKKLKVWIKTHPFLRVEEVLKKLDIDFKDFPFEIKNVHIEEILAKSKVVIAGESSVAIEALAFGCRVIILETPEMFNMSTIRHIKSNIIRIADSPYKLKEDVCEIVEDKNFSENFAREAEEIVKGFFYFNHASNRPVKLLDLLN